MSSAEPADAGPTGAGTDPAESLVLGALWGGSRVFRWLALAYAAWGAWARREDMMNPGAVAAIFAALTVWTALQHVRDRSDAAIHLVELVLGCLAVYATRWFDTPEAASQGVTTIPGVWQSVPIVSLAIILGWRGGLLAALLVSAVMVAQVGRLDAEPFSNAGLQVLLGTCVGVAADVARKDHVALQVAVRRQAELVERERLARTVHDGVLQALAFIHRRGLDLGGEAARLGVLASEQESRLRALVSGVGRECVDGTGEGPVDLRSYLGLSVTEAIALVAPAEPVLLAPRVAAEVAAAVEAALDNVRAHAGRGARAWILIDDLGADLTITVRDDGVGTSQAEIEQARARGRLGVASSIRGRVEDLGGTATYVFGPGPGTTLQLWVPKKGR